MNFELSAKTILLTFDVEDWFQVENFKQWIPFSSWPCCELRVEKNTHKLLDLLDLVRLGNSMNPLNLPNLQSSVPSFPNSPNALPLTPNGSIKATFFVLGWIAERLPHLVREIQVRGHEVASHGYSHRLCGEQSTQDLKSDLTKSKKLLEDITGTPIHGYRAPSFSIDNDRLKLIEEVGYSYDSSFNSFRMNKRYGQVELKGSGRNGILFQVSDRFYEIPISNLRIGKQILPWGGGGYFRLIPAQLFKHGVQSILKNQGAYLFYLHPWEIDPGQPRMSQVPKSSKFRHYLNLSKTVNKLLFLIDNFKNSHFETCCQHITQHTTAALQHRKTAAH
jgi:polysaccharide deacetylase family protein (PEP-CTERM system associated)